MNPTFGAEYLDRVDVTALGGRTSNLYSYVSGGVTYVWSAVDGWTRQD